MQLERGRETQVKGMSRGNERGKKLMQKRCGEKSGWGGAEENR